MTSKQITVTETRLINDFLFRDQTQWEGFPLSGNCGNTDFIVVVNDVYYQLPADMVVVSNEPSNGGATFKEYFYTRYRMAPIPNWLKSKFSEERALRAANTIYPPM